MGDSILLDVFVPGVPAAQGSKRYLGVGSKGKVRMAEMSKRVEPWRADIRAAIEQEPVTATFDAIGPMAVDLYFTLPRPKSHHRTGGNAHLLRDDVPAYPAGRPDLDKLVRAVLDAVGSTGRVWNDDAQVVHVNAWKHYATPDEPIGVQIAVRSLV